MKLSQLISLTAALIVSTNTLAESGGDKRFETMMQNNRMAMQRYAAQQGKEQPIVKEYAYGMKLDVVKVVNVTPPIKSCGPVPAQMTYEDARGQLNTLRYTVAGGCNRRGG
ncbi:DUF2790 domain-containing protein [Pseudomonas sp. NPDC087626]|uniref:DUF2790 domain-containing protein n=1 Tax=Pseudomonas sp. NPDC087626 TaxID=3364444 RepID=UPI0037F5527D